MATKNPKSLLCRLLYQEVLGNIRDKPSPDDTGPRPAPAQRLGSSDQKIVPEGFQVSPRRRHPTNSQTGIGENGRQATGAIESGRDKSLILH